MSGEPLALEQNLALTAGAGAGKTYSLITLCLHLLAGARAGGAPLKPAQLCLLTFTDKAAAELRRRLRERLDALASGDAGDREEPELRQSFSRLGRTFPRPDLWRRIRDDLGSASIGTFHSLCMQLLRRAPAGYGVDPAFELLEERDALGLIHDTAERVVLEALEREEKEVEDLCRELGFTGGGFSGALVDSLRQVFTKVREEGLKPEALPLSNPAEVQAELHEALAAVKRATAEASSLDMAEGGKHRAILAACSAALDGMTADNLLEPARFPALRRAAGQINLKGRSTLKDALKALKYGALGNDRERVTGLLEHFGACRVLPHEKAFRALLAELASQHRRELSRRGALDFSELLIRARDLLRDHPVVRREVQERYGALLVDEFQDTNRLQLELVTLIAERREGAPRPLDAEPEAVLALPLEPRFLCAVGDRKQSIYEFRGADVSVFGQLAEMIVRDGGRKDPLQVNRRSSAQLLSFFNRLFARVMAAAPERA
jgi:ATP-dependent helicase/nuclease subunit A